MLITRLFATGTRRFSTLRKPVSNAILNQYKPTLQRRMMSGGVDLSLTQALVWFAGCSLPIITVGYIAVSDMTKLFENYETGKAIPIPQISNDKWLEMKEKFSEQVKSMAEDEDEDDEEDGAELTAADADNDISDHETATEITTESDEHITAPISQEVEKDTIIFVEAPQKD